MKTIFTILLSMLGGFLFGMLLVRFFIFISNLLLKNKAKKEILKNNLTEEEKQRRNFFFRDKSYNLKEQVEHDLKNYKPWYKKIFNRRQKGVSDYGNNTNAGNTGLINKQVPTSGERSGEGNTTNTQTATPTGKQPSINTPETRGEQRIINRGLFEERTKNHRLLL